MTCLVVALLVLAAACEPTAAANISNSSPRRDTSGQIVAGGDGNIIQWNGSFILYAEDYGGCREEPVNGTLCVHPLLFNTTCGFQLNHTVVAYSSSSMQSGTWQPHGVVLHPADRPEGVLFRPKIVYNVRSSQFVLWFRVVPYTSSHVALNWSAEMIAAATSPHPYGPFEVVHANVPLAHGPAADFSLFVDEDDSAYILYTSHATTERVVVEKLAPDYTSSTLMTSELLGPEPVESPVMTRRGAWYYVLTGHLCCYCVQGSNAYVYASRDPLGPYTALGDILHADSGIHAQLNYVLNVGSEYMLTATRWGSAPDDAMRHDFQYWTRLQFDNTTVPRPLNLTWVDSFVIDV